MDDDNVDKKFVDDILNLKRKAFFDKEAAKKLDLLHDIVTVKNVEETDFFKDMLAVPYMIGSINNFLETKGKDAINILGINYFTEYMIAMQEFATRLKPLYVRLLIEELKNGQ